MPALVDRQPGPRGAGRRAARCAPAGRSLHALPPPEPVVARVPARLQRLHRRLAQARHERVSRVDRGTAARGRLPGAPPLGHLAGQRGGRRGPRARAHSLHQLRSRDGTGGRRALRPRRGRHRNRGRRRHRRHQLRREPGARRAHSVDPRDLAGSAAARQHDRVPLRRRAQHRRGGRQHRLGGRGRHAPRRSGERGLLAGAGVLWPGRRPSHRDRRRAGARIPRSGLLPRRLPPPRRRCRARRGRGAARGAPGTHAGRRRRLGARRGEREHGARDRGHHRQPGHRSPGGGAGGRGRRGGAELRAHRKKAGVPPSGDSRGRGGAQRGRGAHVGPERGVQPHRIHHQPPLRLRAGERDARRAGGEVPPLHERSRHRHPGPAHRLLGGGPLPAPGMGDRGPAREGPLRVRRRRRAPRGGPARSPRGDVRDRGPALPHRGGDLAGPRHLPASARPCRPLVEAPPERPGSGQRPACFDGRGAVHTPVRRFEGMRAGERIAGPAIVESGFTTIVVDPGAVGMRSGAGSLVIDVRVADAGAAPSPFRADPGRDAAIATTVSGGRS